jgi:hypothetical protein
MQISVQASMEINKYNLLIIIFLNYNCNWN